MSNESKAAVVGGVDVRVAFEAWYASRHDAVDFIKREDGQYDDWDVALQWNAWQAAATPTDRLLTIIASAYQVAGAHDAPTHILDVMANPVAASDEQIGAMLPYVVGAVNGPTLTPSFYVIVDEHRHADFVVNLPHEAQEHINDACEQGVEGAGKFKAVPVFEMRPTDDELWDATLRDRDTFHEWADKLAEGIATYFAIDIGEHSNQNLPWAEALEFIDSRPRSEDSHAANFIEKRAQEYLAANAGTEHDTGDITWHYGEVGRDYYNTLTELAEEIRALASTTPQKADNE